MPDGDFKFLDSSEDCDWCTPRVMLARHGYEPLPPEKLNETQVAGRLWELLYAAAGLRFFFYSTDHLSDRELYRLLWDQWLDELTADIAPDAETNTHFDLAELKFQGMTPEEIWLRYYADDAERMALSPGELPPSETPPHDRDRFLPTPPIPRQGTLEDEIFDGEDGEDSDPLGLGAVDREIARARGESMPDLAPFESVEPFEDPENGDGSAEEWHREPPEGRLIPLLPPAELTDDLLTPVLWELLHNLAVRGYYVQHTDHMTDRELYTALWGEGLRDPADLPRGRLRHFWVRDFIDTGLEAHNSIWLRYYASDEERAAYAAENPGEPLPSKELPPANRDWRLPKGPCL